MTQGKILLPLVSFTIPLVLGNLFQLTYNAADSVIVGKYVGEQALAAVGTSTPIMNIAILLISGMCMGASVLMSSQYGAKDYDTLSKQISTTMLAGCGFSVVFSLLMLLLATPVLRLIRVPETAIPEAAVYLRIIFLGLIFTFIYNFLANTMRALGDSKTPLYFLVTSFKHFRRSVLRGGITMGRGGKCHCHSVQRGSVLPAVRHLYQEKDSTVMPWEKVVGL